MHLIACTTKDLEDPVVMQALADWSGAEVFMGELI